jgi:anhydro-N-acetylmuramic acid kinase
MQSPFPIRAIGLMSGSSLDGLDIACVEFNRIDGKWAFEIIAADCIPYSDIWVEELRQAHTLNGKALWHLHTRFGKFCGQAITDFITNKKLEHITLVASHGHTVFHYPDLGFTTQIGDGGAMAAYTKLPVICDFRSTDIAKGGQGAPLVPIGDRLLFGQYRFLLNIGGIANITLQDPARPLAFDICPANQVLNHYAGQIGLNFDRDGALAATGTVHTDLLNALNGLDFYTLPSPKSLGNDYSRQVIIPLIDSFGLSAADASCTYCHHIAHQVAQAIQSYPTRPGDQLLITGGGAHHDFLIQHIKASVTVPVVIPQADVVSYKEAVIFALMGILRWTGQINTLHTITGANDDSISGAIYLP